VLSYLRGAKRRSAHLRRSRLLGKLPTLSFTYRMPNAWKLQHTRNIDLLTYLRRTSRLPFLPRFKVLSIFFICMLREATWGGMHCCRNIRQGGLWDKMNHVYSSESSCNSSLTCRRSAWVARTSSVVFVLLKTVDGRILRHVFLDRRVGPHTGYSIPLFPRR